jgi:hypothetical protein
VISLTTYSRSNGSASGPNSATSQSSSGRLHALDERRPVIAIHGVIAVIVDPVAGRAAGKNDLTDRAIGQRHVGTRRTTIGFELSKRWRSYHQQGQCEQRPARPGAEPPHS